jgi:hypothetical protein
MYGAARTAPYARSIHRSEVPKLKVQNTTPTARRSAELVKGVVLSESHGLSAPTTKP